MKQHLVTISVAVVLALQASAHAADLEASRQAPVDPASGITARAYLGYLTARSGEYVYDSGTKLSQLDWTIDNALIAGGDVTFQANEWLSLRAGGWTTIAAANTMDDYDWLAGYDGFDSWSHWSHHPETETSKAFQIDVSAAARFASHNELQFDALAGYRFRNMKWNAENGSYIYSSESGFRDEAGTFEGPAIGYEQWWHTPYLGLGVTYEAPEFRMRGEIIGSPFVFARDRDHHFARDLVFTETFGASSMLGVSLAAERDFGADWTVFGKADFQNYFHTRGDTRVYDLASGETFELKNGAGADHRSLAFTLGVSRKF
ncbi:omptin family outer membrane protease [Mesorhizobium sp. NBSH29]|uniref:omptin family outer membrane protease n=1 Tax=Mesorhizobium sp. NBSH29 TaxID=2654249 RepID=UPI0018964694|nr:omptin family outer membrane protease [Mesorhizobium sp. NBSH29]QPC86797.1 omptin family outer membrane protease [Mesorhizobium sp. NBSH29]